MRTRGATPEVMTFCKPFQFGSRLLPSTSCNKGFVVDDGKAVGFVTALEFE